MLLFGNRAVCAAVGVHSRTVPSVHLPAGSSISYRVRLSLWKYCSAVRLMSWTWEVAREQLLVLGETGLRRESLVHHFWLAIENKLFASPIFDCVTSLLLLLGARCCL